MPEQRYYLGIDIGGTKTAAGVYNAAHQCISQFKYATDATMAGEPLCETLAAQIEQHFAERGYDFSALAGLGVGVPSNVNYETGTVYHTQNIPNLRDFEMAAYLRHRLNAPVWIDNDANLAALAEHRHGAGRGFSNMIYVTASTGIGGGLIFGGKLFRGSNFCAGEVGHMVLTPGKGVVCGCGNRGCFESYASGANIYKHVEQRLARGETTVMTSLVSSVHEITGRTLAQAYAMGDAMAAALLDQMGDTLGILFYNLYVALNVDCIVVGGGLTNLGEALFSRIHAGFDRFERACKQPVYILPSALKQDFGVIGAAELLFDSLA